MTVIAGIVYFPSVDESAEAGFHWGGRSSLEMFIRHSRTIDSGHVSYTATLKDIAPRDG
jgi:hypothetical protein